MWDPSLDSSVIGPLWCPPPARCRLPPLLPLHRRRFLFPHRLRLPLPPLLPLHPGLHSVPSNHVNRRPFFLIEKIVRGLVNFLLLNPKKRRLESMAEEKRCQEGRRLCANCGFFDSPATLDLCSKCYRDLRLKEEQASPAKRSKTTSGKPQLHNPRERCVPRRKGDAFGHLRRRCSRSGAVVKGEEGREREAAAVGKEEVAAVGEEGAAAVEGEEGREAAACRRGTPERPNNEAIRRWVPRSCRLDCHFLI